MKLISAAYYKKYISQNKSESLCEELLSHLNKYILKDKNSEIEKLYDNLIMITGRLKSINQEQLLNIINFEDAKHEKSKIDHSLLKFINQLPPYYFDFINGGEIKLTTSKDIRKNIDDLHKDSKFRYECVT